MKRATRFETTLITDCNIEENTLKKTHLQRIMGEHLGFVIVALCLLLAACGVSTQDIELHKAVRANDAVRVLQLLNDGANVDAPETKKTSALNSKSTSLVVAAGKEFEEIVRILIENGADVNAASIYGSTALSEAAVKGNTTIVRMLLEAGAKVDAANKWGKTPLKWATDSGHQETVEILLQAGAVPLAEGKETPDPIQ